MPSQDTMSPCTAWVTIGSDGWAGGLLLIVAWP